MWDAIRPSIPSPATCRAWAQEDARTYWDAADLYERANGRLYVSADFALPRELPNEDHRSYARQGIDRAPGRHYGPAAAHMVSRDVRHDRFEAEVERGDVLSLVATLERELQAATTEIARGGGRTDFERDGDGAGGRRERRHGESDRTRESGPER